MMKSVAGDKQRAYFRCCSGVNDVPWRLGPAPAAVVVLSTHDVTGAAACTPRRLDLQRDKVKEDGVNISSWLQALARFTGAACRRFPDLDVGAVCQFLANALRAGDPFDLLVLQQIIVCMTVSAWVRAGVGQPWLLWAGVLVDLPVLQQFTGCMIVAYLSRVVWARSWDHAGRAALQYHVKCIVGHARTHISHVHILCTAHHFNAGRAPRVHHVRRAAGRAGGRPGAGGGGGGAGRGRGGGGAGAGHRAAGHQQGPQQGAHAAAQGAGGRECVGYGGRVLGARGLREQATSRDLNKGRTRLLKALEDVSAWVMGDVC